MGNVYVKLVGGIGNQLFQIANGYSYSKKYGKELFLDCSGWSGSQGLHPTVYKNTLYSNFNFKQSSENSKDYTEQRFNYDEIPFICGDVNLIGYYQSKKYFEQFENEFKSLIQIPNIICNSESLIKTVALHIRRGDYLKYKNIHYVCDSKYFESAMDQYFPKTNGWNAHIYTDSPDFVLNEFKNSNFDYNIITTSNELQDLYMLGVYKNMICSNSSFSWWGSYLGCDKSKIITPSRWFNNFEEHDDIYRTEFTKH